MPVRLIALDIDGTLLDEHSRLPAINRDAVAEAAARGIEIALVTGRRYDFATPIARQFPCPLTMIVNNGALVKSSDGETQLVNLLPRGLAARVLDETSAFRELASVCFNRPRENQVISTTKRSIGRTLCGERIFRTQSRVPFGNVPAAGLLDRGPDSGDVHGIRKPGARDGIVSLEALPFASGIFAGRDYL